MLAHECVKMSNPTSLDPICKRLKRKEKFNVFPPEGVVHIDVLKRLADSASQAVSTQEQGQSGEDHDEEQVRHRPPSQVTTIYFFNSVWKRELRY